MQQAKCHLRRGKFGQNRLQSAAFEKVGNFKHRLQHNAHAEQGPIGQDIAIIDTTSLRQQIGVVLQENMLFNRSIRDNIALTNPTLKIETIIESAKLAGAHDFICELAEGYDTMVGEHGTGLSGGQRQRAMIAMALACKPRLLIADEPTTALDVSLRMQILDLLKELQQESKEYGGMSILLITHDLNLVKHFAQRVAVLNQGNLIEVGTTKQVFEHPVDPYTRALVNSEPVRNLAPVMPLAPVLLKTEELSVAYPSSETVGWFKKAPPHKVLKKVNFELKQGQTIGVIGESGSGKTTLGMAVLGLLGDSAAQVSGNVDVLGKDWQSLKPVERRAMRASLQVIFQDPFGSLSPRMSVLQIIAEGLDVHHPNLSATERESRVVDMLKEVGLDRSALYRYPHEFSGGQRQRIAIARALILRPQILVLDEPTSALDVSIQKQVLALLSELQKKYNLAYLMISHDLAVIRAMSHEVMVLKEGRVVEFGDTETMIKHPRQVYTKELFAAAELT